MLWDAGQKEKKKVHIYNGLISVPVTEKPLHNRNNNNNKTTCCSQWYFSNSLFPKWPDSILRDSCKETVIWKHISESLPMTFHLKQKLPTSELKVAQPMNKALGYWFVSPRIQERLLSSPYVCPSWMSSLSPLSLHSLHLSFFFFCQYSVTEKWC